MPHKRAKRSTRDKMRSERSTDLPPSQCLLSSGVNDMPKSMARVLNAETIRKTWKEKREMDGASAEKTGIRKKRKAEDISEAVLIEKRIMIKPGESLLHFERRVEDDMRPLVRSAMTCAKSVSKRKQKEATQAKEELKEGTSRMQATSTSSSSRLDQSKGRKTADAADLRSTSKTKSEKPTEFPQISSSAPKRLNDVAQAPPELKVSRLKSKIDAISLANDSDGSAEPEATAQKRKSRNSKLDVLTPAQRRLMELERERAVKRYRMLKEAKLKVKTKLEGCKG